VRLRPATPHDADAIARLYRELVDDAAIRVLPERLAELAAHADHDLLVVEIDDAVVGTAHIVYCRDAMYGLQPYALVENVVVTASARGAGVGAALMREIDTRCLAHNCSKIMLMSSANRGDAHRFFAASSYDGERKRAFVKYRRYFQPASPAESIAQS
jgi:GNAT superfamily N-acetyltransferase